MGNIKARDTARVHGRRRYAGWIPEDFAYTSKVGWKQQPTVELTTASRTGRKILAVPRLDVTSVNRPLITITTMITTSRGTPLRNLSAFATVSDNPEIWTTPMKIGQWSLRSTVQTLKASAMERLAPSSNKVPQAMFLDRLFHRTIGSYFQPSKEKEK